MKITVAKTRSDFERMAAARIVGAICAKPGSVVGLSTGRTTGGIHRAVCEMHDGSDFDVSKVTFFGVDEVTGVDREYAGACYTMLKTEIVDPLGIPEERFLMLPTESDDFAGACAAFTGELARRGGIDLLMLGLGENGHLGFNQPGADLDGTACTASMDERLEERIRRETASSADKALGGVTLGLRDMMHARRIVLVANGANKRAIVKALFDSSISSALPASVLKLHPDCEFLLDNEAAADIDVERLRKLF